jgi:hypothetical protein
MKCNLNLASHHQPNKVGVWQADEKRFDDELFFSITIKMDFLTLSYIAFHGFYPRWMKIK